MAFILETELEGSHPSRGNGSREVEAIGMRRVHSEPLLWVCQETDPGGLWDSVKEPEARLACFYH